MSIGKFITLEGIDGAGKTTQWNRLKEYYSDNSQYIFTRNPGGTLFGKQIRELVLHNEMSSIAELYLYGADRAEHINSSIKPALDEGKIIICDRFCDSTIAYQGYGRGIDLDIINTLNNIATQSLQPDMTILFDIDPEVSLQRAKDPNKFEAEGLVFQKKIRQGYLDISKQEPERVKIINTANNNEEQAFNLTLQLIQELI